MRLGLNLNAQVEGIGAPEHAGQLLEQARAASANGFSLVTCGQHYLTEPMGMFQPMPLLGAVAQAVPDVEVATTIILGALENPVRLAEEVATVDVLSRGRFTLGIGLGYRDVEFGAFGVEEPARRFRRVVEGAAALLEGRPLTLEESWCSVEGAALTLRPVQRPRPPIWVAANSDAGVRRAARLGDAWLMNPHARVATLRRQQRIYRDARGEAGDAGAQPIMREMFIAETSERARTVAEPFLREKYRNYVRWGQDEAQPPDDSLAGDIEHLMDDRFIVGDPEECLEQLRRLSDELRADPVIVRLQWSGLGHDEVMRALGLVGRHVVPSLGFASVWEGPGGELS